MKIRLILLFLALSIIAVPGVLSAVFYLKLSPAYAHEFEEVFYCGTVNEDWLYADEGFEALTDTALIRKYSQGKTLFDANCVVCHSMHQIVVGPQLAGVTQRRDSIWLADFIRNPEKMVVSGDSTAIKLYNDYNQVLMPAFNLSEEEINQLVGYLKLYENN